jgi:hypothetical protein
MRVSRTRDPMIDMSVTISFKQNNGILAASINKMVKAPIAKNDNDGKIESKTMQSKKSLLKSVTAFNLF